MKDGRKERFSCRVPISVGQRFGMLVVLGDGPYGPGGRRYLCQCDCGKTRVVIATRLKRRIAWHCGCHHVVRHGDARRPIAPEYKAWAAMKERCHNQKGKFWHRYGGRGITVCERWLTYENFLADMGRRPSAKHSLDRADNNGNYEPGNCRWVTFDVQRANQEAITLVEVNGVRLPLKQACRALGLNPGTIQGRIKNSGWSLHDALTIPIKHKVARAR